MTPEDIFVNHYECCECGHRWEEPAGRGEPHSDKCPLSTETWEHLYFKWLNYSGDLIASLPLNRKAGVSDPLVDNLEVLTQGGFPLGTGHLPSVTDRSEDLERSPDPSRVHDLGGLSRASEAKPLIAKRKAANATLFSGRSVA